MSGLLVCVTSLRVGEGALKSGLQAMVFTRRADPLRQCRLRLGDRTQPPRWGCTFRFSSTISSGCMYP